MRQMKLTKYLLIIGCVLSVIACGTQNKYTPEDMDLPEDFLVPDSVAQNMDTIQISRNTFFKDSVLVSLIDEAFENNFDLRLTNKDIDINDALFKQSKQAFYPEINLNLMTIERRWYSHNSRQSPASGYYDHKGSKPKKDLFQERLDHISSVALDWEVDIWGKLRNQKKEASAIYQQSHIAKRAIQTELVATIAEDYYTLLMLDEQLDVAHKNHKFRDSTLTMINLLYDAGEVSALAVQQAQTQVLDASSLISELTEERIIRENGLRLLVGDLPGEIERGFKLQVEDSTYAEVKELPLYLVQNRPDVVVAQYGLTAANARVGVTQAQRLPNLTISLEGGVASLLPQNWFNVPGSLFGSVLGGIGAPLFNGRKLKTEQEVAMLERDKAEIDFQRKVYGAVMDIQNSLASLKGLEEQLGIADVKQLVSEQALENSRMLFQSGYANYLEVITAQGEAMNAELSLVRTKADLLTKRIQLYRALGGGWR